MMKKGILLLLLAASACAQAQSLKDALFSGKLKNDPGTVIRKGDDLSTKIDTARKVTASETEKAKEAQPAMDAATKKSADSSLLAASGNQNNSTNATDSTATALKEAAPAPKNNTVLWKDYVDTTVSTIKTEVLSSKKIKAGTYYVTVAYSIGTDGMVNVDDVFVSPENALLQKQIKERLSSDPPRLSPVLNSVGTPHKSTKRYNFTITKQ